MLVCGDEGKVSQWEIEADFRTLQRASEILKDEKRVKEIQKLAQEQKKVLDEMSNDDFYKNIGLGE